MTNLPTKTHLTSGTTTEAQFQAAIGGLYDVVSELVGANGYQELEVSSGSITPSKGVIHIRNQADSNTGNLNNIVPTNLGEKLLIVRTRTDGKTTTIQHNQSGSGKILTQDGTSIVLRSTKYFVVLKYNSSLDAWEEIFSNFRILLTTAGEKTDLINLLGLDNTYLKKSNNLSDVTNAGTARNNLALGSMATQNATNYLAKSENLSGLANITTARNNLGLGSASTLNVGTSANQVVQLDGTGKLPAVDGSALTNIGGTLEIFTSNTSWNKPSGVQYIKVKVLGAGASGGVTHFTNNNRSGGSGGYIEAIVDLTSISSSVTITVGQGGVGHKNTNASDLPRIAGGSSSFGTMVVAAGGDASGNRGSPSFNNSGNNVFPLLARKAPDGAGSALSPLDFSGLFGAKRLDGIESGPYTGEDAKMLGAGGAGGNSAGGAVVSSGNGGNGIVIIEYFK